jgi:hypothetical protein
MFISPASSTPVFGSFVKPRANHYRVHLPHHHHPFRQAFISWIQKTCFDFVLYKRVLETVIIDPDPCHADVVGTIVILVFKHMIL